MSESQKSAVLAKCEELTKETKYASDNDDDWDLEREDGGFILEAWGGCIKLNFCKLDDADHEVWQLAADILKITPTIDEFEADLSRRQYHHDLEQARKEGYEQGKAEVTRPSDDLLCMAYSIGACNPPIKGGKKFKEWLATIPPDTLKADRELVKNIFRVSNTVKVSRGTKLWETIARLAGMEAPNE